MHLPLLKNSKKKKKNSKEKLKALTCPYPPILQILLESFSDSWEGSRDIFFFHYKKPATQINTMLMVVNKKTADLTHSFYSLNLQ